MKTCPFSWLVTSQTWTIDGRLPQTKQRLVLNSGACAMWRHLPKPVPTWIRFVRLGTDALFFFCAQRFGIIKFCLLLSAGVLRPDERDTGEKNGRQQREEWEEEEQKFGQEN